MANDENGNLGEVKKEIGTTVENTVNISAENMAILREGFHQVVHGTDPLHNSQTISQCEKDPSRKKQGLPQKRLRKVIQILRQSIVISWHTTNRQSGNCHQCCPAELIRRTDHMNFDDC